MVIDDPIPAGATIVGDLGGQSKLLADQVGGGRTASSSARSIAGGKLWDIQVGVVPAYVERGNAAWRAYYAWVPRGRFQAIVHAAAERRWPLPPARVQGRGDVHPRRPRACCRSRMSTWRSGEMDVTRAPSPSGERLEAGHLSLTDDRAGGEAPPPAPPLKGRGALILILLARPALRHRSTGSPDHRRFLRFAQVQAPRGIRRRRGSTIATACCSIRLASTSRRGASPGRRSRTSRRSRARRSSPAEDRRFSAQARWRRLARTRRSGPRPHRGQAPRAARARWRCRSPASSHLISRSPGARGLARQAPPGPCGARRSAADMVARSRCWKRTSTWRASAARRRASAPPRCRCSARPPPRSPATTRCCSPRCSRSRSASMRTRSRAGPAPSPPPAPLVRPERSRGTPASRLRSTRTDVGSRSHRPRRCSAPRAASRSIRASRRISPTGCSRPPGLRVTTTLDARVQRLAISGAAAGSCSGSARTRARDGAVDRARQCER